MKEEKKKEDTHTHNNNNKKGPPPVQPPPVEVPRSSRHRDTKKQFIGGYAIERTIGEGSYASVKSGIHVASNEKVALKIFDKHDIDHGQDELQKIFTEINILKDIDHPNIVQLYDVVETPDEYYLVLE